MAVLLSTDPVVVALSVARLAEALGNSLLIVLLPLYVAATPSVLDLPDEVLIGLMVSAYGFAMAGLQPVAGRVTDRSHRPRALIVAGLAVMSIATLAFAFADRYLVVAGLRVMQGVGVAFVVVPALTVIAAATDESNRGNAMGVYGTFRMAGFAVGPLLAGLLHTYVGFGAAFAAGALCVGLAALVVWFALPAGPTASTAFAVAPEPELCLGPLPHAQPMTSPVARDDVGHRGVAEAMWLLGAGQVVLGAGLASLATLENLINAKLGQSALGFGLAFSALTAAQIGVQIPLGRASDRVGRKRILLGGFALLTPLLAAVGHVESTVQLVLVTTGLGVATAAIVTPSLALAGDLAESRQAGRQMSLVTTGFALGLAVGPLSSGVLGAAAGLALPFYVLALAAALFGVCAAWRLPARVRPKPPSGGGAPLPSA